MGVFFMFDFFHNYQIRKKESNELKELRASIDVNEKSKMIDKLLESDRIDKIILKFQGIYHKISERLFIKFDLKNELKQGKIFTILITLLIFIYLIIITVFFGIMLNSLIGLNLIFSLLKYSLFSIKWGYTILKKKGGLISKYLANLFPNSKVLKEEKVTKIDGLPIFETNILKEIDDLVNKISDMEMELDLEKEIVLKLKEIVNSLNLHDESFKNQIKSLEYKKDIITRLESIKSILDSYSKKEIEKNNLLEIQTEMLEKLDLEIDRKTNEQNVKIKKLSKS